MSTATLKLVPTALEKIKCKVSFLTCVTALAGDFNGCWISIITSLIGYCSSRFARGKVDKSISSPFIRSTAGVADWLEDQEKTCKQGAIHGMSKTWYNIIHIILMKSKVCNRGENASAWTPKRVHFRCLRWKLVAASLLACFTLHEVAAAAPGSFE